MNKFTLMVLTGCAPITGISTEGRQEVRTAFQGLHTDQKSGAA